MRGSSEISFSWWTRRWPEYRRVHCSVLLSRHREGGESIPYQRYTGAGPKGHTIDIGQDSMLGITPPGLAASDVLCNGVHETHDLRLEYYTTEQHETLAQ